MRLRPHCTCAHIHSHMHICDRYAMRYATGLIVYLLLLLLGSALLFWSSTQRYRGADGQTDRRTGRRTEERHAMRAHCNALVIIYSSMQWTNTWWGKLAGRQTGRQPASQISNQRAIEPCKCGKRCQSAVKWSNGANTPLDLQNSRPVRRRMHATQLGGTQSRGVGGKQRIGA